MCYVRDLSRKRWNQTLNWSRRECWLRCWSDVRSPKHRLQRRIASFRGWIARSSWKLAPPGCVIKHSVGSLDLFDDGYRISSDVLHVRGESFIEPKSIPPVHRYQVTKPLVSQFVSAYHGGQLKCCGTSRCWINQQELLSFQKGIDCVITCFSLFFFFYLTCKWLIPSFPSHLFGNRN